MAQTAQQSDFVSERSTAQPARDIVSNSSDSETSKTWSSIASKIWSSDSSKSDAANSNGKPMDFSVPKALSDSLGLSTQLAATQFQGIQPLDAQAQLENRGLLPKTRISPTGAEGQRNGVVRLPDIEMARAGQGSELSHVNNLVNGSELANVNNLFNGSELVGGIEPVRVTGLLK